MKATRGRDSLLPAVLACLLVPAPVSAGADGGAPRWRQPLAERCPDLYPWSDTCNVYVLRDGDAAILIDLGDGSVLPHLGEIGVTKIDWLLFTHHHREQCQPGQRESRLRKGGKGTPFPPRDLIIA